MTDFSGLGLIKPLQRSITAAGYVSPTPIQAQSIPHLIRGRDLLGIAQTGTGKTAAFVLPILQSLTTSSSNQQKSKNPRALILAPTRELAIQIGDSVRMYGKFLTIHSTTIFGGVSQNKQVEVLKNGVDILVATPGRLLDLINQEILSLREIQIYVLDEADRMLDMGFINDVKKITKFITIKRQTLLFSATMPKTITQLAVGILSNPIKIEVAIQSTDGGRIDQRVLFVEKLNKRDLLGVILEDREISRALIFTRTKHGANRVAKHLEQNNIQSGVIHGNKSQNARQKALKGFKDGKLRILVATDIAARGIDIDNVTHVINFDLPNEPETYVHRIGRTARAGTVGQAISFCDEEEREHLFAIEKSIDKLVDVEVDHPYHAQYIEDATKSILRQKNKKTTGKQNSYKNRTQSSRHKKKWVQNELEPNNKNTTRTKNIRMNHSRKKTPHGVPIKTYNIGAP